MVDGAWLGIISTQSNNRWMVMNNEKSVGAGKALEVNSLTKQASLMSDNVESMVHLNELLDDVFIRIGGNRPTTGSNGEEAVCGGGDGILSVVSERNKSMNDQLNKAHSVCLSISELL